MNPEQKENNLFTEVWPEIKTSVYFLGILLLIAGLLKVFSIVL